MPKTDFVRFFAAGGSVMEPAKAPRPLSVGPEPQPTHRHALGGHIYLLLRNHNHVDIWELIFGRALVRKVPLFLCWMPRHTEIKGPLTVDATRSWCRVSGWNLNCIGEGDMLLSW